MFRFSCLLCLVVLGIVSFFQCFVDGNIRTIKSCNEFKLANGRMRMKPKGRLAKFQCNRGYLLAGEKYSYCVKGSFDVPPPVCVKSTCPKIKQLTNGIILPSYNGGVANFYCKPGFTLRGTTISYCDGSRWSHNLPACISTHMPTPTSCDFETEDFCGWSHDLNHDFDWRRQNFQTPSGHIGTGPKHDHTKGNNMDGYYVYIESTSRLENDTARLVSPLFRAQPHGVCFTFWYHMYGRDMGVLKVYLRRDTEQLRTLRPMWTQQGNHGDVWRKGKIEIEEGVQNDFQIIIEGIRGKSYVSDIAIDDVALSESCPEDEEEMYSSSSTTESSTDDDSDVFYGSCANRCNENNTEIILGDSGSCECNESCYERNTCCPDYTIVCLIAAFEESTTDFNETYSPTEITDLESSQTSTVLTTNTPESVVTKEDLLRSTRETELNTTTIYISSTTNIPIIMNTTYQTTNKTIKNTNNTTTEHTEDSTTTSTPVTVKVTTTNPPKINTTKPTKPTPNSNKNNNNIDKIITTKLQSTVKPTVPKPKINCTTTKMTPEPTQTPTTTKLPTPQETESITILTSQTLQIETDYELTTLETITSKLESKVEMVVQNVKIAKPQESNLTLVIFCTSALVVIGVVVAVVIFAKFNARCRRIRFRNSRNSDSMSDVRFLASDEVLDFTWRSSDM